MTAFRQMNQNYDGVGVECALRLIRYRERYLWPRLGLVIRNNISPTRVGTKGWLARRQ